MTARKRVAMLITGCGAFDGSDIHHCSAALVHLSRAEALVRMFAPNVNQMHVVDHLNITVTQETRNVLVESARLARGEIEDLQDFNVAEFDVIFIPGGLGVVKNLISRTAEGKRWSTNDKMRAIQEVFANAKRPFVWCCVSPVSAAKVNPGCEAAIGKDEKTCIEPWYPSTETASQELGCKHINRDDLQSPAGEGYLLVTFCPLMCKSPIHKIFDRIGTMLQEVLEDA